MQFEKRLLELEQKGNLRTLKQMRLVGKYIHVDGKKLLNLASNDYLGVATDEELKGRFFDSFKTLPLLSSASARLLSGNCEEYFELESLMAKKFGSQSVLVFGSGYHMNIGIIPSVCDSKTLILADKLIHASLIDGIVLSRCKFYRYEHNNLEALESLIKKHYNDFEQILVVTESIFSMDGDEVDVGELIRLRQKYKKVMLYVDEAHGVGVRGKNALGLCEEFVEQIDFLVGTFGKALGSVGGYLVSSKIIREFVINSSRSFIFSTALAPINLAWSRFVLENIDQKRAQNLGEISKYFRAKLEELGYKNISTSQIVPLILSDNHKALELSNRLYEAGIYAPAIRPPTVKEPRIRFSLTANLTKEDIDKVLGIL